MYPLQRGKICVPFLLIKISNNKIRAYTIRQVKTNFWLITLVANYIVRIV